MIDKFLSSNSTGARFARTVFQAVLAVIIANITFLIGNLGLSAEWSAIVTALVMCILSPLMSLFQSTDTIKTDDDE